MNYVEQNNQETRKTCKAFSTSNDDNLITDSLTF